MRLPISAAISCSAVARQAANAATETTFPVRDRGRGEAEAAQADLAEAVQVVDLGDPAAVAEAAALAAVVPAVAAECESAVRGPAALNSAIGAGPMAFTA